MTETACVLFSNFIFPQDTSTLSACTYICAVYEEVARDPEGCDLLTLLVLVREEAVLPFLRLLQVRLNLQQSA